MRSSLWLVGALGITLSACGGDAFRGHPDTVALAAGQELSTERLAELLTKVKGVGGTPEEAQLVASLWVDYTLFAQAIAEKRFVDDSATIMEVMWKDVAEMTSGYWFDRLLAERAPVSEAAVDSSYATDSLIVVQHVLLQTGPTMSAAEKTTVRRKIDSLAGELARGADFGAVAIANSADAGTLADSGFMMPVPKGAFVPEFDNVAWGLRPGQTSRVVETQYGYHIIRRASDDQAKVRFRRMMQRQPDLMERVQSEYFAELDSQVQVARGAVAKARKVYTDVNMARGDDSRMGSYGGIPLTVDKFGRWVRIVAENPVQAPMILQQLNAAPDSAVEEFIRAVGHGYLMIHHADSAGAAIDAEDWTMLKRTFDAQVDTVRKLIGLTDTDLDPNAGIADRERAAALKVDQFFDRMADGSGPRLPPLPGVLAWTLRGREPASISPAGIQQAVSIVRSRLGMPENGAVPGAPEPQIVPAPGGPPVGGETPPPAAGANP